MLPKPTFSLLIPLLLLLSSSASVYSRSYIYQQTSSSSSSQPTTSASSTYGKYERIPVYVASGSSPASSYGVAVSAPASAVAAPTSASAVPSGIATSSMYFQLSPQAALPSSSYSSAGSLHYPSASQGFSYLPTLAAHQLPSSAHIAATPAASPNYEVLDVASMAEDNGAAGAGDDGGYDGGDGGDARDAGAADYTDAGNGGGAVGGAEGGEYGGVVNERLPASEEYGAAAAAQANFDKVGKGGPPPPAAAGAGEDYGSSGSSSAGSYETAAAAVPVAPAVPVAAPLPVAYAAQPQIVYQQAAAGGCAGGAGYACHAAAVPVSKAYPSGGRLVGPIIHYPSVSGAYHPVPKYAHRPVIYKPAPISLSPSIGLVPQTAAVPVALAHAPAVKSHHHHGFGKFIDLKKFEDLLPALSTKGTHLETLFSALAGLDLPSLTLNMPKKLTGPLPRPGVLIDQLFASTSDILPHIKLPAPSGPPVIASPAPVVKAPIAVAAPAPAVAIAKPAIAPVAITKTIGHEGHGAISISKHLGLPSLSKLKLPELPSLDSLTSGFSGLGGLGDLLSKLTKFEIVKRVKLPPVSHSKVGLLHHRPVHAAPVAVATAAATSVHPVAVPHPQARSLPPRKIVTAYPLQRGPYSGHVVIEDFPFGRPQYGPFDEGGEATLGCDQLDGAAVVHPAVAAPAGGPAPAPVAKY